MYRIVLIDDEQVVRDAVAANIPWREKGFDLVAACRDGREGLEAVRRERPEVVLTDICMPFVDGLELTAAIREELPETRTILLTGYDDFEYAQEAVKLRAEDFLLKPITAEELSSLLDRLKGELDSEQQRRKRTEFLREQLQASLPVYRERFLNRLVRATISPEELSRGVELLDLDLPGPLYAVMLCDLDPPREGEGEEPLRGLGLQTVLRELVDPVAGALLFGTAGGGAVVLLSVNATDEAERRPLELAERIDEAVEDRLNRTVSIGIGEPVDELARLPEAFQEARSALEQRLLLGVNRITTIREVRGGGAGAPAVDVAALRERFIRALRAGLLEEASEAVREISHSLRRRSEALESCYVVMHQLLSDAIDAVRAIGLDYAGLPGVETNPFEQFSRIKTLEEMERWFLSLIRGADSRLDGRRKEHSELKAVAAREFIEKSYADPDLSLYTVCRELSVSKSYLSPVFKSHTGMTILEYLTARRIEEAKLLLRRGELKVYEVAERVGFRDPHYFSLTFRKQTGLSPTEFREHSGGRAG